jgi:hypothetical protein
VAKKLSEIEDLINSKNTLFFEYLEESLDKNVFDFIKKLSKSTDTYLFSGIIRNFFLENYTIRDIDLIIESESKLDKILNNYQYRKNSFGGYKLSINHMDIDIWSIKNSWALNHGQITLDFEIERYIPSTAFFNFSAVLYSIRNKEFLYTKSFLNFLISKEIDVVYEPNANYQLCLVNTFYYSDRYRLIISDRLKEIIKKIFTRESNDYSEVQKKHFGKILYENKEIERRIISIDI